MFGRRNYFPVIAALVSNLIFANSSLAAIDLAAAINLVKAGQYQKALSLLDKGVDDDPTNGDLHFWRGKCLNGLGKKDDAISEFKLATLLAADPKTKDLCKAELTKYKVGIPRGSVNSGGSPSKGFPTTQEENENQKAIASDSDSDKFFKLSSKKLDWNLQMNQTFLRSMNERTQNLGKLASAGSWRMPPRNAGNIPNLDIQGAINSGPAHRTAPLTADERRLLSSSDIVILLDHSGSMQTLDCPSNSGPGTRFNWCIEEMLGLTNELSTSLDHGLALIPFDSKPEVHYVRGSSELVSVLRALHPGGGTDLASAFKEAFKVHSNHIAQPLLIAVVSDAEVDLHSCEQVIVDATRRFPAPNGVFITLLQIGHLAEVHTADTVHYLDNLDKHGAAYDAFKGIPFSQVRADGFGKDLLIGLRANLGYFASSAKVPPPVPSSGAASSGTANGAASTADRTQINEKTKAASSSSEVSGNSSPVSSGRTTGSPAGHTGSGATTGLASPSNVSTSVTTSATGGSVTTKNSQSTKPANNTKPPSAIDPPPVMWPADSAK